MSAGGLQSSTTVRADSRWGGGEAVRGVARSKEQQQQAAAHLHEHVAASGAVLRTAPKDRAGTVSAKRRQ